MKRVDMTFTSLGCLSTTPNKPKYAMHWYAQWVSLSHERSLLRSTVVTKPGALLAMQPAEQGKPSAAFCMTQLDLQVKGVPLIAFDVGGVGEMLHYSEHEDVIVMDSSAKSLASKLQGEGLSSSSPTAVRGDVLGALLGS